MCSHIFYVYTCGHEAQFPVACLHDHYCVGQETFTTILNEICYDCENLGEIFSDFALAHEIAIYPDYQTGDEGRIILGELVTENATTSSNIPAVAENNNTNRPQNREIRPLESSYLANIDVGAIPGVRPSQAYEQRFQRQ
jgi:hypothetical protein